MRDLFRTLSREIRLALVTAQLNSTGAQLFSAGPGQAGQLAMHSQRDYTVQACARGKSSPWLLPTWVGCHTPNMIPNAHLHLLHGILSRQNLSKNKPAELSVVLLASLPHLCMHCITWMRSPLGPTIPCSRALKMRICLASPGVLGPPKTPILQRKVDLHSL